MTFLLHKRILKIIYKINKQLNCYYNSIKLLQIQHWYCEIIYLNDLNYYYYYYDNHMVLYIITYNKI